jgi:hypothetical protein
MLSSNAGIQRLLQHLGLPYRMEPIDFETTSITIEVPAAPARAA